MSNFNSDARSKRSDASLGSLDYSDTVRNETAEHGWRKGQHFNMTGKTSVMSSRNDTMDGDATSQQPTSGADSDNFQLDISDSTVGALPVAMDNTTLSSDDEGAMVYEADLPEMNSLGLRRNQQESVDDGILYAPYLTMSTAGTDAKKGRRLPTLSLKRSMGGGKNCFSSILADRGLDESSDGDSIKYETDLQDGTSMEPELLSLEKEEPFMAQPVPVVSLRNVRASMRSLRFEKNESLSSDDDFLVEDQLFPLLKGDNAQCEARNFAMEHRIFIKSLMALLEQRDMVAVDMDDPNTLKCGPLKKATHIVKGAWKVKYVEIRRGMFSYYDDSLSKDATSEGDLVRKNIHLNANTCVCRAVKLNHKSLTLVPGQAIFELSVEGSPRRFWMANSREERLAWIRAINDAMVGGATTRGEQQVHAGLVGRVSRKSPYRRELEIYLKIQREIRNAYTKQAYVGALMPIVGKTLNVPVRWISEQNHLTEDTEQAFREVAVTTGVNQLWKDLARDSVQVNGELFKGGSGNAPERIVGAVTREIMRMDRSSPLRPEDASFVWKGVTELQALSFARDILLSCNRTRSGGDSYYCVDALTNHPGMVVLVPSALEAEPLSVTMEHFQQQPRAKGASYSVHDRIGWLKTRTRQERQWKRRYFVLSEGTLSVYKKGHPRPYGLEGQIKVADTPTYVAPASLASIQPAANSNENGEEESGNCFIVTLKGKEGIMERQILFEDEDKFLIWAYAFEAEISKLETMDSPRRNMKFFQILQHKEGKDDSRIGFILGTNSLEENAETLGFEEGSITSRAKALALQHGGGTKSPTVNVLVRASTTYKICTLDPQGDESEDTWA